MPLYYVRGACRYEQSHYEYWKVEHEKDPSVYSGYADFLETKALSLVADSLKEAKEMFIAKVERFVKIYDAYLDNWSKSVVVIAKIKDVTIAETLRYSGDDYSKALEDVKEHLNKVFPGIVILEIFLVDEHIWDCEG